jgi:hypothetical protein
MPGGIWRGSLGLGEAERHRAGSGGTPAPQRTSLGGAGRDLAGGRAAARAGGAGDRVGFLGWWVLLYTHHLGLWVEYRKAEVLLCKSVQSESPTDACGGR